MNQSIIKQQSASGICELTGMPLPALTSREILPWYRKAVMRLSLMILAAIILAATIDSAIVYFS